MTGRRDERTALRKGACELAEHGLRIVPLRPKSKIPRIRDWPSKATSQVAAVDAYWRKWPTANIGVATGDGIVVIDLDNAEALAYAQQRGLPARVPTVRTGRAGVGQHLYFAGDAPTSRGTVHPAIDVRGRGALAVAPPSIHPDTAALYEWVIPPFSPLPPLPAWVLETKTTSRVVEAVEGRLVKGNRNDGLYKLASAMRGIGMIGEEVEIAMLAANQKRCDPPLEEDEVSAIADSALRHPVGRPIDKDLLTICRIVKPSPMAVYVALRKSCGAGNECKQSYAGLAAQTGMGEKTAERAIGKLVEAGLVEKKDRPFPQSNEYRLLDRPAA